MEIQDDQEICQYGTVEYFRCKPKDGQDDVSMTLGPLSAEEAHRVVVGDRGAYRPLWDLVRCTSAGSLRSKGFEVKHTPFPANQGHVSVEFRGLWSDNMCQAFHQAFEDGLY
jgi:hypothetical protein